MVSTSAPRSKTAGCARRSTAARGLGEPDRRDEVRAAGAARPRRAVCVADLDRARVAVAARPPPPRRSRAPPGTRSSLPVVRRPVAEPERDAGRQRAAPAPRRAGAAPMAGAGRGGGTVVEAADAAEARRSGDSVMSSAGLVDQLLREQDASGLRHRDRRRAQVLREQAAQMALADARGGGERRRRRARRRARPRRSAPGARDTVFDVPRQAASVGRRLGPAAQAGAEAGLLGRGRAREERRRSRASAVRAGQIGRQ